MATSIPKTMRGISIAKTGGPEVLEYREDLPVPVPKEGQVLLKNEFAGINYIDTYFRTGLYKAPSFPYTLGRDASGIIVSLGPPSPSSPSDPEITPGARAVYLAEGTYAEYTVAPAEKVYVFPASQAHIDNETAVAALLQGLTALTLIREAHKLEKGDWVLVHAAAGGVGLWLCNLLKHFGMHTIGTASTPEKQELAKKNGAEVMLDYADKMGHEQFVSKVKEVSKGGVTVVFDGVGKSTFDVSLECVARKGTMVSFGNASGAVAPLEIARLSKTNAKVMRPTLMNSIFTREEFQGYTKELFDIMVEEEMGVKVHEVYALGEAKRAHEDIEGRGTTGKLLLRI